MAKSIVPAVLTVWMSLLCHAVACQQPVSEPPAQSLTPRQLAEAAIARLKASADSRTRFTNFALIHTLNSDIKGKKTFENLELFEETWINDLPYERVVELNGKPLKGRQLRKEQERYDQAIANRQPFAYKEHALLQKTKLVSTDASPLKALGPGYVLREVRQEDSPHGLLHIIEATSTQPMFAQCRWRYLFSISDQTPTLFEYRSDVDDRSNPSDMCKGVFDQISWDLVDGIPQITHFRDHFFHINSDVKRVTIDGEGTFTQYRRFTTKVTIGPATVIPPDAAPPQ